MKRTAAYLLLSLCTLTACTTEPSGPFDTEIASKLNNRYQDTAAQCADGLALYHCNGVLIRVTDSLIASPGELERNAAAFSYLRADLGIRKLFARDAGVIMSALPSTAAGPISVRCSFPTNGATGDRPDGCGETSRELPGYQREWSRHCDEQGVVDGPTWLAHFNKVKPAYFFMCAFRGSVQQFSLSITVRKLMPANYIEDWNEVVTSAWTVSDIDKVPFQAFFYNAANLPGRDAAKKLQREYYGYTQRLLPVVRVDLLAQDQRIFAYHKEDQITIPVQ